MGHRHAERGTLPPWVGGLILLTTVLCASAIPGYTWRGGGHGGGGHGFHGGHGRHGVHGGHWGYRGHGGHGFYGGHGWGGVGVNIDVGPYWGAYWRPYGYPYSYLYGYLYGYPSTYAPQIAVQPAQPVVIQPPSSPPVWYYCDNPAGYYPYVNQCPGGWRTVAPSPQ